MYVEEPSAVDLRLAWQDASRAADLAQRLAHVALETAKQLDATALQSEDVATLAEHVVEVAVETATTAREVAIRADGARRGHDIELSQAGAAAQARGDETAARERYEEAGRPAARSG